MQADIIESLMRDDADRAGGEKGWPGASKYRGAAKWVSAKVCRHRAYGIRN